MVRKIIISVISISACVIGIVVNNFNKEHEWLNEQNSTDISNTIIEESENIKESPEENNIANENTSTEIIEDNNTITENHNDNSVSNSNKNENSTKPNNTQKNTNLQEEKNDTKQTQTQVEQKVEETQATETKEEKPVEVAKEEYIYNNTETLRLINDINEIAKRNSALWREDGSKKYEIDVSANLIGKNYMSPYSKGQLEGIVLNVFSVKFLVYAVDYKKPGFETQTRYYIDIAEYENK